MSLRSVRQGLPDMWRTEAEEAENNNQEKHSQSGVQRGYHLRHPPGERRTSQFVHHGDGLWSVSHCCVYLWAYVLCAPCHKLSKLRIWGHCNQINIWFKKKKSSDLLGSGPTLTRLQLLFKTFFHLKLVISFESVPRLLEA